MEICGSMSITCSHYQKCLMAMNTNCITRFACFFMNKKIRLYETKIVAKKRPCKT